MNHCFLNCVIQALWSLQTFRERFLAAPEHEHSNTNQEEAEFSRDGGVDAIDAECSDSVEHCCYCALKSVFKEYKYSEAESLPPDVLRTALSNIYTDRGRFKLGEMEDATETIEVLLDILHASSLASEHSERRVGSPSTCRDCPSSSSTCAVPEREQRTPSNRQIVPCAEIIERVSTLACQPPCIAHEVFGIEYVDLPRCSFCHATGEPTVTSSFLYPVYVAELLAHCGAVEETTSSSFDDPLSAMSESMARISAKFSCCKHQLQEAMWKMCQRSIAQKCPECNSRLTMESERWLTRRPCTFLVSLVWPNSSPSRDQLWMVMSTLQSQVWMDQIFRTETNGSRSASSTSSSRHSSEDAYMLCGLICYFGMHYIAIFWNWPLMKWMLFDDSSVRQEQDWSSVVQILIAGHYVPTLLFYERLEGRIPVAQVDEFMKQVANLEDRRGSCTTM